MPEKEDKKKKVWEHLLEGVRSAVELRIVTFIGEVELSGDLCKPDIKLPGGQHKAIVTCVNLVEGDITSCFPDEYTTEERSWVRSYHDEQVKQGKEIVNRNLRLIAELGERLAKAIGELRKTET